MNNFPKVVDRNKISRFKAEVFGKIELVLVKGSPCVK